MSIFIAKKTVTIHNPGGGTISLVKDQEVKPGVVKKMDLNAPGSTKRYIIELSDNYIERQNRWCRVIEKDLGVNVLMKIINLVFLSYLPHDKKVGQWCVGKQNKIHSAVVKQFGDVCVNVKNTYKSSTHNWDGDSYTIVVDDDKLETIEQYINLQCLLLM